MSKINLDTFIRKHKSLYFVMNSFLENICKIIPDKAYLSARYFIQKGERLNLKAPSKMSYNEKLQWLKLYDRKAKYTQLVDKFAVRDYIERTIGKQYLVPLLGVWGNFNEINIDTLPEQFVLKCNHDSNSVLICKDKKLFGFQKARKHYSKCLKRNHFYISREWPYKNIKPCIIAEELIQGLSENEVNVYKIYFFSGEPKFIQVDFDFFAYHRRNLYTPDWKYLAVSTKYPTDPNEKIPKPEALDEMISISRKLSKDYVHVRVDLYYVNNKIYFNELTFYPDAGFGVYNPKSFYEEMSEWLILPDQVK